MTKHDTWVKLKPGNPYEPILDFFPDGMIPMRDPFPLERTVGQNGEEVALWIIDVERLSSIQFQILVQAIAISCKADAIEVAAEAELKGGLAMNSKWVASMQCWVEGFARAKELADFLSTAPDVGTPEAAIAFQEFCNSQYERWVEGNQEPPPINSIDDIHPSFRTPELEQLIQMLQIEQVIQQGAYSLFDVLTGRATVNALNIINPENSYSLVGDDEFDEDEIYE
ncbi:MAG: hypothetical protein V7K48_16745 [Nostoc sp.]|uniref:hypothetical protein n=1 Tax=Nostoc sp. TaxID=1180 RepID=UPI002FF6E286